jgi:hypothetical protein
MNYRRLGRSGLKVSEICLGAWINFGGKIEDEQTFAILDAAVEEGIDFFDTADVYAGGKAEEVMGRWMKNKDRRALTSPPNAAGGCGTGRTARAPAASTSWTPATTVCAACRPTTSTCTRFTAPTATRPPKKPCAPWTNW